MSIAVLSDISLMWLIFWTLIGVIPFGVLFFCAIKGLHRLRPATRKYLRLAQSGAKKVSDTSDRVSHQVTAPIIGLRAKWTQVNRLRTAAFRRRQV